MRRFLRCFWIRPAHRRAPRCLKKKDCARPLNMELAKVVLKKGVLLGINYLLNSRSAENKSAGAGRRDGHTVEGWTHCRGMDTLTRDGLTDEGWTHCGGGLLIMSFERASRMINPFATTLRTTRHTQICELRSQIDVCLCGPESISESTNKWFYNNNLSYFLMVITIYILSSRMYTIVI